MAGAGELEQRRCDVGHVRHGLLGRAALHARPPGDRRYRDAAFVHEGFVQPERRRAHLRPARAVFGVRARLADVRVAVVHVLVDPLAGAGNVIHRVAVGAVVGQEEDEGVVELAGLLQVVEHAADVLVHVVDHRRVYRHALGFRSLLGSAQAVPLRPRRMAFEHRRVGSDQAELLHALETFAAQRVVAVLVARLVLGDVGVVRVQRPVRRGEGEVGEEGLARILAGLDVIDQPGGEEVGREEVLRHVDRLAVLAVDGLRRLGRVDRDDAGLIAPVARSAMHEHVGLVEAARRRAEFLGHAEVPLAGHQRAIAGVPEHLRHRHHALVEVALVAGLAALLGEHQLGHVAEADEVVVAARHQHGAGRRTERRRIELGHLHPGVGERVQVRRGDLAAEAAEVGVAEVVGHDEQDVGAVLLGGRGGVAGLDAEGDGRQGHQERREARVHCCLL